MRLPIVAATAALLLLVLDNVAPTVGAAKQQQRYQLLRSKHKRHTRSGSYMKAQARSADTIIASAAPTLDSDQQAGDSGRGFLAKLMMFKSMLQPQQQPPPPPPPSNNIIILSEPTYVTTTTPTTPTTTSTSPSTFTSPTTTSVVTNSTRSGIPNVVYARHDKNALTGNVGLIMQQNENVAPTMTAAQYLDANAAMPLFMDTKPVGMTNQIPMIAQLPRPIQQGEQQQYQQRQRQQQRRRNNRGGQLNQNKRRRRLQQQQNQVHIGSEPNNRPHKRRRVRGQGAVPGKPLQRVGQRRKVAKFPNQNRIVNGKGDNDVLINDMSAIGAGIGVGVGVGAGSNFDTNSRLQQIVNGLRHPQTPIVYNYH